MSVATQYEAVFSMNKVHFLLAGISLASSQLGMGCSRESVSSPGNDDREIVGLGREALTSVISADYVFPASLDPEIDRQEYTQLWARVYAPASLQEGKRYPLLVFQHGVHGSCGDASVVPRVDTAETYQRTGECQEGQVVVENHAGYGYLAEEMAAHGYIVVSVNASRGLYMGTGYEYTARGRLILKHLEKLARWDQGLEPTPPELGFDLQGHLDFEQVGLMGHSRGGISVVAAHQLARNDSIDWTQRLGREPKFRSIFQIAPVDAGVSQDPVGVPVGVLLPLCDGEVFNLEGVKLFDRSMALEQAPGMFRATVVVSGANHRFFNTEWQYSELSSEACIGQVPLFQADQFRVRPMWGGWYSDGVSGSELQREVGMQLISRFFLGTVGAHRDPSQVAMFDPRNQVPAQISDLARIERGFSAASCAKDRIEFEDFQGDTGVGPEGELASIQGVEVQYAALYEHDESYRGAHITWESAGASNFFEPHLTQAGQGVDLEQFDVLEFRVDPSDDALHNVTNTLNFSIRLVDGNGGVSQPVDVSRYVTLLGGARQHSMLQTVRIPLSDFGTQIPLTRIRGIRFSFDDPSVGSGSIYLASIRAIKDGQDVTPALGDVNGDCAVDRIDAELVAQASTGAGALPFPSAADVNCSGSIDILDALLIAQFSEGRIAKLGCE